MKRFVILTFAALFLFSRGIWAEDDFQYWQRLQLKVIDTKYFDYMTYGELRFAEDASDLHLWQTSQKFQLDPVNHLSLGINYTYLEEEVLDSKTKENDFKYHNRLELEVNPYFSVGPYIKIKNRNRMEFRWIEDKGSDNGRFRQMWHIEVPIKGVSIINAVYTNNELFYDFSREQFAQNRWIPAGVAFKIYKENLLRIFYMIQSVKGRPDWSSNQILGTHVELAF